MKTEAFEMQETIALSNEQRMREKLEHLQSRARRLRIQPFTFAFGEPFKSDDKKWRVTVTARGQRPVMSGWRFAATLEIIPGSDGHLVKSVPGMTLPSLRGRDPALCEHCRTRRVRKETFIIINDSGELKQVGRECLQDYVGNDVAAAVAMIAVMGDLENALGDDDEEEYSGGGGGALVLDLEEFLSYVAAVAREDGFISSKMVQEGKAQFSTASSALDRISRARKSQKEGIIQRKLDELLPKEVDVQTAESATAWALQLPATSDFNNNLRILAKTGYVRLKNLGIAAYIVGGYLREQGRRRESQRNAHLLPQEEQHFLGTVGERRDFDAIVLGHFATDGFYGTTHIYRLAIDGCQAVWFASREEQAFLEAEDRAQWEQDNPDKEWLYPDMPGPFRITATVKEHKVNRRDNVTPETVLTRVTVWTKEGIRQAAEKAEKAARRASSGRSKV